MALTKVEKIGIFNNLADVLRQNQADSAKKLLMEYDWLLKFEDDTGRRAVHWAAVGGCLPFIELINSLDPEALGKADDSGWTLLLIAASAGRLNVIQYLLGSVHVDVNHRNNNGQTALHYACSKNHPSIVKLLLENGAEINVQDKYGAAPVHRAAAQGHIDIVRILSEHPKFRIQISDNEGNSPLHLACEDQHDSLALFLAKLGANIKAINKAEKTPLDLCRNLLHSNMSTKTQIFELLEVIDNLKHLVRTGWQHYNVPCPETVSGHMYRMAILAMTLSEEDPSINALHCVKMALVHDIGEAIVGDITPRCGVSDEEKFKLEEGAVKKIASFVPKALGDEWFSLWLEYEAASTPEAKAVKQLDKFDMIAQAMSYEEKYGIDLEEFFKSTVNAFSTEPFVTWNLQVRERRAKKKSSK